MSQEAQNSKKKRKRYPYSLIEEVVQAHESGQYSYQELAEKFGISSRTVAWDMVKKYREKQYGTNPPKPLNKVEQEDTKVIKARLAELEEKLESANLKAEALDTMIDIAEKTFKINIRKKSGSQQ